MTMRQQITARRETVKLDRAGNLERWVVFEYTLDDFGPFVFEYPKAKFSYDLLKADMANEEKGIASINKQPGA